MDSHVEVAQRLVTALETGDTGAAADLYADGMTGWRNFDDQTLGRDAMLRIVGFLAKRVKDVRYEEVRVQPTETGYVQQHVLRAVAPDGRRVEVPACLVVRVEDGRIQRIDEYMDRAALAPLL